MAGRITLVGAGELMAAMSPQHRAALARLKGPPHPVFIDTTAGFETNVDSIVSKAVEYYEHHLQTPLRVASFRHRDETPAAEVAAAVAEIRAANLIFAGPGSPTYSINNWKDSAVWQAVCEQFEAGADLFFASAASITLGRYSLPVYEIYKAGMDPFWVDGLDMLGRFGLRLAVVPHFNDSSGGENYDSRFCYMGARRFDILQERLPPDVAIVGVDAYTSICFDPETEQAIVSGQSAITLIAEGEERRFQAGNVIPFSAFRSASRGLVRTFDASEQANLSYAFSDSAADPDPLVPITEYVESLSSLPEAEKVELLARIQAARNGMTQQEPASEASLIDLVLDLRQTLRSLKQFQMADKARKVLEELGFEVGDTTEGATWTRK